MRVIGGSARGKRLKGPRGDTRPTSDLVRGAIFDALDARAVAYERVLDLYAGTGALGIEALSRGADWCDFVERDRKNVEMIKENLAAVGLADRAKVYQLRVERAVERLAGPYDLVLADPPYGDAAAVETLQRIAAPPLISADATLVYEHGEREEPPPALGILPLASTRRYGDTRVSIYHR